MMMRKPLTLIIVGMGELYPSAWVFQVVFVLVYPNFLAKSSARGW